jgi:hypothetical protein
MRTRLALVAVLAALAAGAVPSSAAPTRKPQIVDPATDALGGQASTEIVSALWTTTGDTVTTKYRGRTKTAYTPRRLVVTLNLAGAPSTTAPFSYETSATVAGCGTIRFVYTPGTAYSQIVSNTFLWYDCGPTDPTTGDNLVLVPGVSTKLGAKSITWEYPIKALPKEFFKVGAPFTEFRAAVDAVDPVLGLYGTNLVQPIDEALGTGAWKLGS